MKSIMLSIQPQWVEKILNKEKIAELRKNVPKCDLPCKVYIYCTHGNMLYDLSRCDVVSLENKVKQKLMQKGFSVGEINILLQEKTEE